MTGPAIKSPRRVPLGGLTEAGRIAEFQSPLQQAIRHSLVRAPVAPAPSRPSQGSVSALTPLLVSAARLRIQGNLAQAGHHPHRAAS